MNGIISEFLILNLNLNDLALERNDKCSYICSIEYGTNDLIVMFRCLKISFLSLMKYAVNALSKC